MRLIAVAVLCAVLAQTGEATIEEDRDGVFGQARFMSMPAQREGMITVMHKTAELTDRIILNMLCSKFDMEVVLHPKPPSPPFTVSHPSRGSRSSPAVCHAVTIPTLRLGLSCALYACLACKTSVLSFKRCVPPGQKRMRRRRNKGFAARVSAQTARAVIFCKR